METMRKKKTEMKDILTEMKNNLKGINSRMDEAQNQLFEI